MTLADFTRFQREIFLRFQTFTIKGTLSSKLTMTAQWCPKQPSELTKSPMILIFSDFLTLKLSFEKPSFNSSLSEKTGKAELWESHFLFNPKTS